MALIDTPDPDAIAFDAAHTQMLLLQTHPTVQSLAKDVASGALDGLTYMRKLLTVPEVAAAVKALGGVGVATASAVIAGVSGPFGIVTGPAAAAVLNLALNAAVGAAQAKS